MPDAVTEIADFYQKYKPFSSRVALEDAIAKHIGYGTITVMQDDKGISGLMRFDMIGDCCHVLDLIIREDLQRTYMLKLIAITSWGKFPYANYYRFERKRKYPHREPVAHRLTQLLKEK